MSQDKLKDYESLWRGYNYYRSYYVNNYENQSIIKIEKINIKTEAGFKYEKYDWHHKEYDGSVKIKYCDTKYVSIGIGDDYLNWTNEYGILVSSQTGSGKNTMILEKIIPLIINRGERVLIVSNRIALNLQMKLELAEAANYKEELKFYTDEGLISREEFGSLTIKSYQKLGSIEEIENMHSNDFKNPYKYVIFDEVHFYTSDASFNHITGELMELLRKKFSKSIRIYMTATPDLVFPKIIDIENELTTGEKLISYIPDFHINQPVLSLNKHCPLCYEFVRNYKYIEIVKYFRTLGTLVKKINNTKYKWMIFVDNKKTGEKLLELIGKDIAVFITADSKNSEGEDNKEYMRLIKEKKSNKRVVIATSVIDNGINIEDDELKYITIFSSDKDQFLQMLGRKRIKNNQKIELYICSKSLYDLYSRLGKIRETLKAIDYYEDNKYKKDFKAYFDRNYYKKENDAGKSIRKIFYTDIYGKFIYNKMALYKLKHEEHFLASLIYMMAPDKKQDDKEQKEFQEINNLYINNNTYKNIYKKDSEAFIREALSWIGIEKTFNIENYLEYEQQNIYINELLRFIESMVNKSLDKEEQEKLAWDYKDKCVKAYGYRKGKDGKSIDRKDRGYGIDVIKSVLEERNLPYQINSSDGFWMFEKK